MSARHTLNVSLTPKLSDFVERRVASGRYQTASEVIREALRLLEREEQDRKAALESLKAKVTRGASQAERGEYRDGEAILEELRELIQKGGRRKASHR
ncbi:MAG: type II toxin-antitoxin system ParD family antitoxin [Bryobacter sp.]|nr:type II toxin-antitoxin system ParD family antitoxin [Bryobacter sp.]